jgi:hypothetical protein
VTNARNAGDADEASLRARELLRAIAAAKSRLDGFARALAHRPGVVRVDREFDCFGHDDGFRTAPSGVVDWWVEAEFADATSRCFELTLFRETRTWVIESRVTEPGRDGPEPVLVMPTRLARDIPGCVRELGVALEVLLEVAEQHVLPTPGPQPSA